MDIKQIKEIVRTMKENGLTLFELTEGEVSLRMERKETVVSAVNPVPAAALQEIPKVAGAEPTHAPIFDDTKLIKSPMVGVFFAAASPDAKPYVEAGSRVKKGDTLCVIEAMKLLNEITADRDGEIMEVCAADGEAVEYSQVLFKIV